MRAVEEESIHEGETLLDVVNTFRDFRLETFGSINGQTLIDREKAIEMVANLYPGLFRLAVPLMKYAQEVMDYLADAPSVGVFKPGTRDPREDLVDLLNHLQAPRQRFRAICSTVTNLGEVACEEAVQQISHKERLSKVANEYAKYRFFVNALMYEKDLSAVPGSTNDIVALDILTGIWSGTKAGLRLMEVLPHAAVECGIDPLDRLAHNTFGEGKILSVLARQRGMSFLVFSRIACGCDSSCFGSDEEILEHSPHRNMLSQYQNDLEYFRASHFEDAWYLPQRFAMYGSSAHEAQLGPSFPLSDSVDPKYIKPTKDIPVRRRRMGCPVLAAPGEMQLSDLLVDICTHPDVWPLLIESEDGEVSENRSLRNERWQELIHVKNTH